MIFGEVSVACAFGLDVGEDASVHQNNAPSFLPGRLRTLPSDLGGPIKFGSDIEENC